MSLKQQRNIEHPDAKVWDVCGFFDASIDAYPRWSWGNIMEAFLLFYSYVISIQSHLAAHQLNLFINLCVWVIGGYFWVLIGFSAHFVQPIRGYAFSPAIDDVWALNNYYKFSIKTIEMQHLLELIVISYRASSSLTNIIYGYINLLCFWNIFHKNLVIFQNI